MLLSAVDLVADTTDIWRKRIFSVYESLKAHSCIQTLYGMFIVLSTFARLAAFTQLEGPPVQVAFYAFVLARCGTLIDQPSSSDSLVAMPSGVDLGQPQPTPHPAPHPAAKPPEVPRQVDAAARLSQKSISRLLPEQFAPGNVADCAARAWQATQG
jgi:hypothetical protein